MSGSAKSLSLPVNGTAFAYRDEGEGEPLIFVHGSSSDMRTWNEQIAAFKNDYRTIAYSRRYHFPNESIPPNANDEFETHVDDLRQLIESLSACPAHLVGHSWGGLVALSFACKHPRMLRSLTLIEPPVISLHVDVPPTPLQLAKLLFKSPALAFAIARFGAMVLGPSKAAFRKGDDRTAVEIFGKGVLGQECFKALSEARYQQVWQNRGPDRAQALSGTFPELSEESLSSLLLPVLLIEGQQSPMLFRLLTEDLGQRIAHAQLVQIAGASHIVHEDAPDAFNLALKAFIETANGA